MALALLVESHEAPQQCNMCVSTIGVVGEARTAASSRCRANRFKQSAKAKGSLLSAMLKQRLASQCFDRTLDASLDIACAFHATHAIWRRPPSRQRRQNEQNLPCFEVQDLQRVKLCGPPGHFITCKACSTPSHQPQSNEPPEQWQLSRSDFESAAKHRPSERDHSHEMLPS